jgi:hypothetical protein
MDVASFTGLPVGVVPWHQPRPALSVIVKTTFSIRNDGEPSLAATQDGLGLDERYPPPDQGEVRLPSDFAPLKARADLLLAGCLYAAAPALAHSITWTFGSVRRELWVVADHPTTSLPLVPRCLRAAPRLDAPALRVGAGAASSEPWVGVPSGASYDYGRFNVAPAEQQVRPPAAGSEIRLAGLWLGANERVIRMPSARPLVHYVPHRDAVGVARATPVDLVPDTVLLDADRAVMVVTWRGLAMLPRSRDPGDFLVVALEASAGALAWPTLAQTLGAACWHRASQPDDAQITAPAWRTLAYVHERAPLATPPQPVAPPQAAPAHAPPRPAAGRGAGRGTVALESFAPPIDPLPFTSAILSHVVKIASLGSREWAQAGATGGTVAGESGRALGAALPPGWRQPSGPAPMPEPERSSRAPSLPWPALVQTPAAGAVAPPVSRPAGGTTTASEGDTGLTVEIYAAIKMSLWQSSVGMAEVLARHGVDEARWLAHESRQEQALAEEARLGGYELANRLRAALLMARARRADAPRPELSLDDYVALRAADDAPETLAALLKDKGLSEEQWLQLRRQWHSRLQADPELAAELRRKLAEARKAACEAGDGEPQR